MVIPTDKICLDTTFTLGNGEPSDSERKDPEGGRGAVQKES